MKEKSISASKIIPKVGDEVVGFFFNSYDGHDVKWNPSMSAHVGKRGSVMYVNYERCYFVIDFQDGRWTYPLELAHLAYKQSGNKMNRTIEDLLKEIKETKSVLESIEEEKKQKEQALISLKDELKNRGVMILEDVAVEKSEEDMSNPINWKKGDMVACTKSTTFSDEFIEGQIYTLREDCDGMMVRVVEDNYGVENGWGIKNFKFHSRPN